MRQWMGLVAMMASVVIISSLVAQSKNAQPGIQVGDPAPTFRLKDQLGVERQLEEMLKKGPVAVVFFRSAEWCPYCQKQLVRLQNDLNAIEKAGIQLIGISYDSVDVLQAFSSKHQIKFPLLSDPDSKTIGAYAVKNEEMKGKNYGKISLEGIPHPGTFLIDTKGKVVSKIFLEGYKDRAGSAEIITAAAKLK